MSLSFITPNWPAPANIKALTTTRNGGMSQGPYNSFNLGDHVGDKPEHVAANRARLKSFLALPNDPKWITQVHGVTAVLADTVKSAAVEADASFTAQRNMVCAVMTADCVPVLLCAPKTGEIAAIHAGWRGLCDGVIESTVKAMNIPGDKLIAWIGPCISQAAFEVGEEVRIEFITADPLAHSAFKPNQNGRWQADLVKISTQRLQHCNITGIYGGQFCTYRESERFYSYRRDNQTGRMATLIWRSE